MRVGVLRTQVPFVSGGAERHSMGLVNALEARGYDVGDPSAPTSLRHVGGWHL